MPRPEKTVSHVVGSRDEFQKTPSIRINSRRVSQLELAAVENVGNFFILSVNVILRELKMGFFLRFFISPWDFSRFRRRIKGRWIFSNLYSHFFLEMYLN